MSIPSLKSDAQITSNSVKFADMAIQYSMKIVFTGGGTAGHVTPNIALINLLEGEKHYVGTDGMEKQLILPLVKNGKVKEFHTFKASKFVRKFTLSNLLLPYRLLKSIAQCRKILKNIAPDVVFGKGGYVALPVIIAARLLKIPAIIHESDGTMGLANKIAIPFCSKVLSTFPCHRKADVCGAIIRPQLYKGDRQKGLSQMGLNGKKPVILFTGGSLGAAALNQLAVETALLLHDKFDIFVLSGKNKSADSPYVHQEQFVNNIEDIFAATSVAVTRGGSNTLCELTALNIPFVVLPLEKCSRGEQKVNAEYFRSRNCGTTLSENCTPEQLAKAVTQVYENRRNYIASQKQMHIDGTAEVLNRITETAKRRH